ADGFGQSSEVRPSRTIPDGIPRLTCERTTGTMKPLANASCTVPCRRDRYAARYTLSVRRSHSVAQGRILARFSMRRDGRVVDGGGLENHCTRKGTGGSNPSPSAKSLRKSVDSAAGAGEG